LWANTCHGAFSLKKIFNIVTQEEQHKKFMVGRDDQTKSTTALVVRHGNKNQVTREKVTCKHYRCVGHEESSCYEIIRYPPGWESRGKARGRGKESRGGQSTGNRSKGEDCEAAYTAAQFAPMQ